jgi:hypothetical protein
MRAFRVSTPDGSEGRAENPLQPPKRRLDSSEHCFRDKCVPDKLNGNKFLWSTPQ